MTLNRVCQLTNASACCLLLTITSLVTIGLTNAQPRSENNLSSNLKYCKFSQLSVRRVDSNGAMGHIGMVYAFTNISSSSCILYGYPGFVPLTAKGQPLPGVKTTWSERNYMHRARKQKITLAPGDRASFEAVYSHISSNDRSCAKSAKVEITPPNTYRHFSLAEKLSPCREIFVTPVEAGTIEN
jgi:hypothetical protein